MPVSPDITKRIDPYYRKAVRAMLKGMEEALEQLNLVAEEDASEPLSIRFVSPHRPQFQSFLMVDFRNPDEDGEDRVKHASLREARMVFTAMEAVDVGTNGWVSYEASHEEEYGLQKFRESAIPSHLAKVLREVGTYPIGFGHDRVVDCEDFVGIYQAVEDLYGSEHEAEFYRTGPHQESLSFTAPDDREFVIGIRTRGIGYIAVDGEEVWSGDDQKMGSAFRQIAKPTPARRRSR